MANVLTACAVASAAGIPVDAMRAAATAFTGLVPSYNAIGIAAPILLVLCRLVQGFSTGGEWGGAAAFLVEYAPPGKRGLIYLDDGSSQRSLASPAAAASNVPFVKADLTIDAVPAPGDVERALNRLETIAREFLAAVQLPVTHGCFAVAGPVVGGRAVLTNLPWIVHDVELQAALRLEAVEVLNDLAATAVAAPRLGPADLLTLQDGAPVPLTRNSPSSCAMTVPGL